MSRAAVWTLLLALTGGFVDAVGFLALFHLFTAHMSGNSVWFGTAFGLGDWRLGLHHLFPIPLFVIGIAAGTTAVELAQRRGVRARFAPALTLEALLLTAFMVCGSALIDDGVLRTETVPGFYAIAALPALAMGVQNATLRRVAGQIVHTTYVTGVLQSLGEGAARYVFWLSRQAGDVGYLRALRASPAQLDLRAAAAAAAVWLAYIAGAIGGGFGHHHWQLYALALPLAVLTIVISVDLARPGQPPDDVAQPMP